MKVIEVTHPIQKDQLINENVAMAFGFFDGMHRGCLLYTSDAADE